MESRPVTQPRPVLVVIFLPRHSNAISPYRTWQPTAVRRRFNSLPEQPSRHRFAIGSVGAQFVAFFHRLEAHTSRSHVCHDEPIIA
jgi:hypothetical protein